MVMTLTTNTSGDTAGGCSPTGGMASRPDLAEARAVAVDLVVEALRLLDDRLRDGALSEALAKVRRDDDRARRQLALDAQR